MSPGPYPAVTLKQAQKIAIKSTTTQFEFAERYFQEIVKRTGRTPAVYAPTSTRNLSEALKAPGEGHHGQGHPVARLQEARRRRSCRRRPFRRLLKRMCDYAIANGLVQVNPAASLPMRFVNVENLGTERKVIVGIFPKAD